jgi:glutathionylspermidine synthase
MRFLLDGAALSQRWSTAPDLRPETFAEIRLRTIFDCCKWDPQFGDRGALAPFPLILSSESWQELQLAAEALARETLAAEEEILGRPELWRDLRIPRAVRCVLKNTRAGFARVMRFDFHLTSAGWRISEVNSDVPGGFVEGSGFASIMATAYEGTTAAGNAAEAYSRAIARAVEKGARIGLVHATAYSDDRQVMVYLGRMLSQHAISSELLGPGDVTWNGEARSTASGARLDALVRFFPAEWLPNLPRRSRWSTFFGDSPAPLSNPGSALLTQSKRLPLIWDRLTTSMTAWRALLPETLDPRHANSKENGEWVLKPVFGRVGEGIGIRGVTPEKTWKAILRSVRMWPSHWIAQRRFPTLPLVHGDQTYFPCVGVFVIDGKAAGTYGRIATNPIVDSNAMDIAVLLNIK